jgi:hypothetical protein
MSKMPSEGKRPEVSTSSQPHVMTLDQKVEMLANQLAQVMEVVQHSQAQAAAVAEQDIKMKEPDSRGDSDGGSKPRLPKFAPPQPFDGTMKETKSFISSVQLYIKGREPEFRTAESKIMFALSYIQGGKAQFWRNEAIKEIAAGHKPFKSFEEFLQRLETQFGDPNPKATATGKLKTMRQGAQSADEFILQFKSEATQTDLGDVALIEYLKAGLNSSLFKSIYRLPVMPTTLEEWYEWAMKLDWQYRQEQAESRLLHTQTSSSSKFGKLSGRSQGKAQEPKAQPPATAVTLPSVPNNPNIASDAMDVDRAGRRAPIKCYTCGKPGHTSRNCTDKRQIREVTTEEEENFPEESQ